MSMPLDGCEEPGTRCQTMTIAFSQKPFLVLIISIEKPIFFNITISITMVTKFTKFIPRSFLTHKSISVKGRSMKSILSVFVMNIRLKASNKLCTQYSFTVQAQCDGFLVLSPVLGEPRPKTFQPSDQKSFIQALKIFDSRVTFFVLMLNN